MLLQLPCILLQPFDYEFLIDLLLKAESQKRYFFVIEEGLDVAIGFFPFMLVNRLKDHSILGIGDKYLVLELAFFHVFEQCDIANSCSQ